MIDTLKPILSTPEVRGMLPGKGQVMLRRLRSACWLAPIRPDLPPLYRRDDVDKCLRRLEGGESPSPIHRWKASIGMEGARAVAHLIPAGSSKAACGAKGEWMVAVHAVSRCTRCSGAAKYVTVEE